MTVKRLAEKGMTMTTPEAGIEFARSSGARAYCECSALTQKGIKTGKTFLLPLLAPLYPYLHYHLPHNAYFIISI